MKVYIVIDDENYETTHHIAAYDSLEQAEQKMSKMNKQLAAYDNKQKKLVEDGTEFLKPPPHYYRNLRIIKMNLISRH